MCIVINIYSFYCFREPATFSVVEGRERRSYSNTSSRMGSEKYKLKWSKYESNILNAFHGLLESETLSDVTLFCEGEFQMQTTSVRRKRARGWLKSRFLRGLPRMAICH